MLKALTVGFFAFVTPLLCIGELAAQTRNENKIAKLKTESEVEALLKQIDKKAFDIFTVNASMESKDERCKAVVEQVKPASWVKADFDRDGFMDLLVNGRSYGPSSFVVMSGSDNRFTVYQLTRRMFEDCTFATVMQSGNVPQVYLYQVGHSDTPTKLIFKFADFLEVNETPASHSIEKIVYKTSGCFGTCPIFELVINADRTAKFDAQQYNDREGKFKGVISKSKYDEIVGALNYIDFARLNDKYAVAWTDDQTSFLQITYDNGKVKTISDYGLLGTFGLSSVYRLLFDLRNNQEWQK